MLRGRLTCSTAKFSVQPLMLDEGVGGVHIPHWRAAAFLEPDVSWILADRDMK